MLDSNSALITEFQSRGMQDKVNFYCCAMILDAYYTMNKPEWIDQENKEYRHSTELHFKQYYKKWKKVWDSVPSNDRVQISNEIRKRHVQEGMQFEAQTISAWLKHILKLK